jgi:inorganic pyrophosphatase
MRKQRKRMNFSAYLAYLGQTVDVVIDRPLGSEHPRYQGFRYLVNYGYLPGTKAGDGEEIDVYVLGVAGPLEVFRGRVIAVIERRDDMEAKLVAAPEEMQFTREEIQEAVRFVEEHYDSHIHCRE